MGDISKFISFIKFDSNRIVIIDSNRFIKFESNLIKH